MTDELKERCIEELTWMIGHFDYINKIDSPGKEDSPQLKRAKCLLKELKE